MRKTELSHFAGMRFWGLKRLKWTSLWNLEHHFSYLRSCQLSRNWAQPFLELAIMHFWGHPEAWKCFVTQRAEALNQPRKQCVIWAGSQGIKNWKSNSYLIKTAIKNWHNAKCVYVWASVFTLCFSVWILCVCVCVCVCYLPIVMVCVKQEVGVAQSSLAVLTGSSAALTIRQTSFLCSLNFVRFCSTRDASITTFVHAKRGQHFP